jgi:hypothetical protein
LKEGRWEWRREEEDKRGGKEKDRCPLTGNTYSTVQ